MSILKRVLQLEPINFRYIKSIDPDQKLRAGFSAQQVQQLFPDAVTEVNGLLVLIPEILNRYIKQAVKEAQLCDGHPSKPLH